MATYKISIPAFTLEINARDRNEALEQFWFDFDIAQADPGWMRPIIKQVTK